MAVYDSFMRSYNKAISLTRGSKDQRQGITGKADASRLPSFAYKWEQLNPGSIDDAQEVKQYGIDKLFETPNSSNVEQILYSTEKQQLFAIFKANEKNPEKHPRSAYVYFNVPLTVYNQLRHYAQSNSGRVGKKFWELIRIKPLAHRYNYKKIRGDERKKGKSGKRGEGIAVKGVYHEYGMPGKDETPDYAKSTVRAMEWKARYHEKKRAEAGSARTAKATGTSSRGKRKTGGQR